MFLCLKAGGKRALGTQAEFVREQMGLQFTTQVATCLSRREVCRVLVCVWWDCGRACRSGNPVDVVAVGLTKVGVFVYERPRLQRN